MITRYSALVAASLLTLVSQVSDAGAIEPDELSGSWALVSADANGTQITEGKGRIAKFADGKVYGNGEDVLPYRIDSTKEPKELDYIYNLYDWSRCAPDAWHLQN
jgi:hypothetical protein